MATAGPTICGACTNNNNDSAVAWLNPSRCTVNDGSSASVVVTPGTDSFGFGSQSLEPTTFGFGLAAGSTILGVLFEAKGSTLTGAVKVWIQGQITVGVGVVRFINFNTTSQIYSSGGAADLWTDDAHGVGAGGWTVTMVNAMLFSLVVNGGQTDTVSIDYIQATVTYTPPSTVFFGGQVADVARRVTSRIYLSASLVDPARLLDPEAPQLDKWMGYSRPVPDTRRDVRQRLGTFLVDPARLLDPEAPQPDKWVGFTRPVPDARRVAVRTGISLVDPARLLDHELPQIDKWMGFTSPVPARAREIGRSLGLSVIPTSVTLEPTTVDRWLGFSRPMPDARRVPTRTGTFLVDPARLLDPESTQIDKWEGAGPQPVADRRRDHRGRYGIFIFDTQAEFPVLLDKWEGAGPQPVPDVRRVPARTGVFLVDPATLSRDDMEMLAWLSKHEPVPDARRVPVRTGVVVVDVQSEFPVMPDKWEGSGPQPMPDARRVPVRTGVYVVIDPQAAFPVLLDKWQQIPQPVPNPRRVPVRTGTVVFDPQAEFPVLPDKWEGAGPQPVPNRRGDRRLHLGWYVTDPKHLADVENPQIDKWLGYYQPVPDRRRDPRLRLGLYTVSAAGLLTLVPVGTDKPPSGLGNEAPGHPPAGIGNPQTRPPSGQSTYQLRPAAGGGRE